MALPSPVLVITDRVRVGRSPRDVTLAALGAGCRWISLREKDLSAGERRDILEGLLALTCPAGATLSVHDDLDAADALGLGLHLPDGADLAAARARLGAGALIGISAHDADGLARAAADANYATLSPVFATASKPDGAPLGPETFNRLAAAAARLPVLALGGINAGNAAQCRGAGLALIGALDDLPLLLARSG